MNKIQGDPPIPDLDDDIVALLLEVFCSKKTEEFQGEEEDEERIALRRN